MVILYEPVRAGLKYIEENSRVGNRNLPLDEGVDILNDIAEYLIEYLNQINLFSQLMDIDPQPICFDINEGGGESQADERDKKIISRNVRIIKNDIDKLKQMSADIKQRSEKDIASKRLKYEKEMLPLIEFLFNQRIQSIKKLDTKFDRAISIIERRLDNDNDKDNFQTISDDDNDEIFFLEL